MFVFFAASVLVSTVSSLTALVALAALLRRLRYEDRMGLSWYKHPSTSGNVVPMHRRPGA